jgi:hypothetical protein
VISGKVYNTSVERDATQVKIACVVYNAQGAAVVDSVFDYSKPGTIAPGKSAGFEIQTNREAGNSFTARCNAESAEFATGAAQAVPEFPSAMAALAGSLAGLAVVYRFRNNKL